MKSKLKIIHSAALLTPSSGMLKQMLWEQEAADELNLDWRTIMYCPSGINNTSISSESQKICCIDKSIHHSSSVSKLQKINNWYQLRKKYHEWLSQQVCDIFILRYYVHDYWQYNFIKNSTKPVLLVHHSFEVPELKLPNNYSAKLRGYLENYFGTKSIKAANGIIGVTDEIIQYELSRIGETIHTKKNFLYPNGYNVSLAPISDDKRHPTEVNLIFIASYFDSWHGLDLLIRNIKHSPLIFKLHLVGNISKDDLYLIGNDTRIIIHGQLNTEQINNLISICDLGLGSFALNRKGMQQAWTLKVREYLSLGLAVYTGHYDIFPDDFKYYINGNIDIKKIIDYAILMKNTTRQEIRNSAISYLSKTDLLSNLYHNLETEFA